MHVYLAFNIAFAFNIDFKMLSDDAGDAEDLPPSSFSLVLRTHMLHVRP